MKIEALSQYNRKHGLTLKDKLIAYLPHYAPRASTFSWVMNLRDTLPGGAWLSEKVAGFSARRSLPRWGSAFTKSAAPKQTGTGEVVLLADTFNNYFESENLKDALKVLEAAGYRVHLSAKPGERPLCCGRTFLASGLTEQAKAEARRMLDALLPFVERGVPVVGLEPSCLLTLRDEFLVYGFGEAAQKLADHALLFEEFLARESDAGRLKLPLKALREVRALLHGHCHQKAFDAVKPVQKVLQLIPGLKVELIESSCCGMAGAFGYEKDHIDVSMQMAELSLLPAVRKAEADTLIVADGTSCRHQIRDGAAREALHVARVLARALA